MAFFKDFLSDIGNIGTPIIRYKKLYARLNDLLAKFSFGRLDISDVTAIHKIKADYAELVEIGMKLPPTQYLKLYYIEGNIETTPYESLLAMKYSIIMCIDYKHHLTYSNVYSAFKQARAEILSGSINTNLFLE